MGACPLASVPVVYLGLVFQFLCPSFFCSRMRRWHSKGRALTTDKNEVVRVTVLEQIWVEMLSCAGRVGVREGRLELLGEVRCS